MMKTIFVFSLSLICAIAAHAQKTETRATGEAGSQTFAATGQSGKSINLASGTHLSGELQNTIDVRKARVGDQVVLKTTQAIKSGGRTVGNVVGGTTSAAGSTVDSTAGVVSNTATGPVHSVGRIRISESSNASVEGSSVLSLQGANLRLEKGTNFNLVLNQSATVGTGKDQ